MMMRFARSAARALTGATGPRVVGLGKVPREAEFLLPRTAREPRASFEAWLEESMESAEARFGPGWVEAFETGEPYSFVWNPPGASAFDGVLTGLLVPSRDSLGRLHPLAIVAEMNTDVLVRAPHVVPLALARFLSEAHGATFELDSLDAMELGVRLGTIAGPTEAEIAPALASYVAWCCGTSLEDGWSMIFRDGALDRAADAIDALELACETASHEHVRLPLGAGSSMAAALWLDIVGHMRSCVLRTAFWPLLPGGADAALIELTSGAPPSLGDLWSPEQSLRIDHTIDVDAPRSGMTMDDFLRDLAEHRR